MTAGGSRQIKLGAAVSYVAILFNVLAGFLYTPWMIHRIGQADYGLYTLTTSVMAYFLIDFGLENAVVKFLSRYRATGDAKGMARFLGLVQKMYLLLDAGILVGLAVAYLFLDRIYVQLSPAEMVKFRTLFVIAGLTILLSFPFTPLKGIMGAHEKFFAHKMLNLLQKAATIVLTMTLLLLGADLYALVIVQLIVGVAFVVLRGIYVNRTIHPLLDWRFFEGALLRSILSFTVWVALILVSQQVIVNLAPTLLGILAPGAALEISVFSIGMIFYGYLLNFSGALNGLFVPRVTQMVHEKATMGDLSRLMIRVGRAQTYVVGFIYMAFAVFGREFLHWWVGAGFEGSYEVGLILMSPCLVVFTQEIAGTFLIVVDEVKYRAILYIGSAALSVGLSILLVPSGGATGAAAAIAIAMTAGHLVGMNVVYAKVMKLDIVRFFRQCHLRILPVTAGVGLVGWALEDGIPHGSFWVFGAKIAAVAALFAAAIWFAAMNEEEKGLVRGVLGKTLRWARPTRSGAPHG